MCGVLPYTQPVTVPTLMVAGYFDAEDFYGPLELYKNSRLKIPSTWCVWSWDPGITAAGAEVPTAACSSDRLRSRHLTWYRSQVQARWFAHCSRTGLRPSCRGTGIQDRREPLGKLRFMAAAHMIEERNSICTPTARCPSRRPSRTTCRSRRLRVRPAKPAPIIRDPSPVTNGPSGRWLISVSSMASDVLSYESEP